MGHPVPAISWLPYLLFWIPCGRLGMKFNGFVVPFSLPPGLEGWVGKSGWVVPSEPSGPVGFLARVPLGPFGLLAWAPLGLLGPWLRPLSAYWALWAYWALALGPPWTYWAH